MMHLLINPLDVWSSVPPQGNAQLYNRVVASPPTTNLVNFWKVGNKATLIRSRCLQLEGEVCLSSRT